VKERLSRYPKLGLGVTGDVGYAGGGELFGWACFNTGAATAFVKLYDKLTAPTEADTPIATIGVPPGSGNNFFMTDGTPFSAGLSARATTAAAKADTGAPGATDVTINVFYKPNP
jgi:hypothetical protein